jgi:hypothetical protein
MFNVKDWYQILLLYKKMCYTPLKDYSRVTDKIVRRVELRQNV